jgi:hypothetical protein
MLIKMCQNSSLNAPGFLSQNTNMYRKNVVAFKSIIKFVIITFWATNCPKQIHDGSGPTANLIVNKF